MYLEMRLPKALQLQTRKGTEPRVPPDLVEWLKENFPPRCIGQNETEAEARYYAAQHELAKRLIRMGQQDAHVEGEYTLEA